MDVQSPHNIMLMQVSEDEYESALNHITPVMVAYFGFLAGMTTPPPQDDMGRNVYWLYVHINKNHYKSVFRMSVEDFRNIRVWQFMQEPVVERKVTPMRKARRA